MSNQKIKINAPKYIEELSYWKEIRASWIANQTHCDPNSPSRREHYIQKGIKMAFEWTGELGFLRYYLFHIDNGYIAGKSKLQRKDTNKGFSPENCNIINTTKERNNATEKIRVNPKTKAKDTILPAQVTNNNFIIINRTGVDIKALIGDLCTQSTGTKTVVK